MLLVNYIRRKLNSFKWRCQRFIRGYSDCDVWGFCDWFVDIIPKMLYDLADNAYGYPTGYASESEWIEALIHMARCAEKMNEDIAYETVCGLDFEDKKPSSEELKRISKIIEENKKVFFKDFERNFFDLWD